MSAHLKSDADESIQEMFEEIGIKINPRITTRGWIVSGVLFGLLWVGVNYFVYALIPFSWAGHMIFGGLPFMTILAVPPMIITSLLLGLFQQPAKSIVRLSGYLVLVAVIITVFIFLLAIAAA